MLDAQLFILARRADLEREAEHALLVSNARKLARAGRRDRPRGQGRPEHRYPPQSPPSGVRESWAHLA